MGLKRFFCRNQGGRADGEDSSAMPLAMLKPDYALFATMTAINERRRRANGNAFSQQTGKKKGTKSEDLMPFIWEW